MRARTTRARGKSNRHGGRDYGATPVLFAMNAFASAGWALYSNRALGINGTAIRRARFDDEIGVSAVRYLDTGI